MVVAFLLPNEAGLSSNRNQSDQFQLCNSPMLELINLQYLYQALCMLCCGNSKNS